jgi:hypothetical protein
MLYSILTKYSSLKYVVLLFVVSLFISGCAFELTRSMVGNGGSVYNQPLSIMMLNENYKDPIAEKTNSGDLIFEFTKIESSFGDFGVLKNDKLTREKSLFQKNYLNLLF